MFDMRKKTTLFIFFVLLCFSSLIIKAQDETNAKVFDPIIDDISKYIPPLDALIDSAIVNSPYLKFRDAEVVVNHYKYLIEKNQYLRNIGIDMYGRYGRLDYWSIVQSGVALPSEGNVTRDEWTYSIGAYMKMPLFDILKRKTTMNLAKKEVEQALNHRNELIHEIRKEVITQYNDLLMRQRLLKIANDSQLTYEIQVKMAEQQFKNGQLPLGELARVMDFYSSAKSEYEQQRTAFITSYSLLEILTGVEFNLINQLQ